MTAVIFPSAYLPPVSWWVLALRYKNIRIENCETFPKQTYRNRCRIAASNGIQQLSIPVKKVNGNHTTFSDIQIDNTRNWRSVHWRSIESAYNKTPYFLYYKDLFEPFYNTEYSLLTDLNKDLMTSCLQVLHLKEIEFKLTTVYQHEKQQPEFRELLHPKVATENISIRVFPRYIQAFEPRHGFINNLSIIDLLFNLGPDSPAYLKKVLELNFNEPNGL